MYLFGLSFYWWGFIFVCGGFVVDFLDFYGLVSIIRDVNSRVERVLAYFVDSYVMGVDCV